ncbi:hypothetical protein CORC01_07971 [Colletotrichum orchidophilum]|uniref:BTB domain-containing protein n=1 Tax=Colletotrichum orchidophilum TaxID=1209926 RepID=A0A1G4B5G4_9PEZI|nr:uncharacterized protein CORC01_07971 [Colletotrichum orchidophilum]OHE96654.1 hypothetical protein CORC01_07971 [Colletotrichum orchidophilum]
MAYIQTTDELTIELHPSWDAALIVAHNNTRKKFLVSSPVLRVTSKYFNALFASQFEEGTKIQTGLKPDITLPDANLEAMEIILSILHYKYQDGWYTLSAKMFAVVAMHCEKFFCATSLTPWVNQWLANFGQMECGDIGYLLVATATLGEGANFQKMSKAAVLQLPLDFDFEAWSTDEVLSALPDGVVRSITRKMRGVQRRLYSLLQEIIIDLGRNQSEIGRMDSSRCSKCLRVYKRDRNTYCPNCEPLNGEVPGGCDFPVFCSSETRVAECTLMFTKYQLYPNEKVWRNGTIAEIARRFNMVRETSTHRCDLDQNCPLKKRLSELDDAVVGVIDSIRGWKLKPIATDEATANANGENEAIKEVDCEGR